MEIRVNCLQFQLFSVSGFQLCHLHLIHRYHCFKHSNWWRRKFRSRKYLTPTDNIRALLWHSNLTQKNLALLADHNAIYWLFERGLLFGAPCTHARVSSFAIVRHFRSSIQPTSSKSDHRTANAVCGRWTFDLTSTVFDDVANAPGAYRCTRRAIETRCSITCIMRERCFGPESSPTFSEHTLLWIPLVFAL